MKPQHWTRFITFLSSFSTHICLLYGMSECNGVLGCHLSNADYAAVPIGYPLPYTHCLLIDEQGQVVGDTENQNIIGEIHIRGQQHSLQSLI
jgi:long-subunit acyl-CoA synthetase (AMP-forming)